MFLQMCLKPLERTHRHDRAVSSVCGFRSGAVHLHEAKLRFRTLCEAELVAWLKRLPIFRPCGAWKSIASSRTTPGAKRYGAKVRRARRFSFLQINGSRLPQQRKARWADHRPAEMPDPGAMGVAAGAYSSRAGRGRSLRSMASHDRSSLPDGTRSMASRTSARRS